MLEIGLNSHGQIHIRIGGVMAKHNSPRNPIFFLGIATWMIYGVRGKPLDKNTSFVLQKNYL